MAISASIMGSLFIGVSLNVIAQEIDLFIKNGLNKAINR